MIDKVIRSYKSIVTSKTLLFLLLSLVAVISFGLDLSHHQIYNLSQLILLENNLVSSDGFYAFDYSPFNPIYYYIRFIVPALEYGAIFIVLSFLLRFFTFVLIYKIFSHFLESNTAIILSTIFLMAYLQASHGLIENGLWIAPVFFPAALSALASLIGINYFIKERYLLSGISFGISIFLHSLYGVTVLAFLFIGFIIILFKKNDNYFIRNLLLGLLPIISSIFYIGYFRIDSNNALDLSYSIYEWFQYTGGPVDNNISLLITLYSTGYCLIPILIAGFYLACKEKEKSMLGLLTICSTVMLFLFICIEIMHINGIFVNSFSEIFIATQMRRGVWIAVLFSLIKIAQVIFEGKENIFNSKPNILLLIFASSTYLFPSLFNIIILYSILFFILRNKISGIVLLSASFMVVVYYYHGYYDSLTQIKTLGYSLFFTLVVVSSMIVIKFRWSNRSSRFCIAIMLAIIMLFTLRGIYTKQLEGDISILMSDGVLSQTNTSMISNAVLSTHFDYQTNLCMEQNSLNLNIETIQLPIAGLRNTKLSLFSLKQLHGYYNPMYSREDLELSFNGLRLFFGSEVMDRFFKENTSYDDEYFFDAYVNLPIKRLIHLRDNDALRFYILQSEREELSDSLICSSGEYYVYDLRLI